MKNENVLLAMAGMAMLSAEAIAQKPANIILINLDDAGNGDFSCRGAIGYQTPHIDWMAANGMSMNNFYAVQPISGASRAGLMTGCYPNRIGFAYALNPGSPYGINEQEETVAELLRDKGYATAIFGKWHLGMSGNSCRFSMVSMNTTDCLIRMICGLTILNISFPTFL